MQSNAPGAADVHRFAPRPETARTETLATALFGALLAFAYFRLAREAATPESIGLALATGFAIWAVYSLRNRVSGLQAVEIHEDALRVEGKRGTRTLRWAEVETARHTYLGGDRWYLRGRGGAPVHLNLEGYSSEEASRINALIRERVDRAREARAQHPT